MTLAKALEKVKDLQVNIKEQHNLQVTAIASIIRNNYILPICKEHKILWTKTAVGYYWKHCKDSIPFTCPVELKEILKTPFLIEKKLDEGKGYCLYHYIPDVKPKEIGIDDWISS